MRKTEDIELLRSRLSYDADTGILTWKVAQGNAPAGKAAGCLKRDAYLWVSFYDRAFTAHRLAFAIHYGRWPEIYLDHINGDRTDNRICNLREANEVQNGVNRCMDPNNVSGFRGVTITPSGRWRAQISHMGKSIHIGTFDTPDHASKAYDRVARELHGEFVRDIAA